MKIIKSKKFDARHFEYYKSPFCKSGPLDFAILLEEQFFLEIFLSFLIRIKICTKIGHFFISFKFGTVFNLILKILSNI